MVATRRAGGVCAGLCMSDGGRGGGAEKGGSCGGVECLWEGILVRVVIEKEEMAV